MDELIQVCYDIHHHATRKRELSALAKTGKDFGCDHLTIWIISQLVAKSLNDF